ncbi:MAG: Small heat shock protein [Francisellaceae bacterium]|nr:Small heat shock protein [Francisellaceae bacterium]
MNLTPYRPFNLIDTIRKDINSIFEDFHLPQLNDENIFRANYLFPKADIKEENDKYLIQVDMPGIEPKDIEVSFKNNVLIIKGNSTHENRTEEQGFLRVERLSGSYYREFPLPSNTNIDEITSHYKNGTLEVIIPKSNQDTSIKKIEVKTDN